MLESLLVSFLCVFLSWQGIKEVGYVPSELWVKMRKRAMTWRPKLYFSSSIRPEPQTSEDLVVRALSKAGGLWLNHGFPRTLDMLGLGLD